MRTAIIPLFAILLSSSVFAQQYPWRVDSEFVFTADKYDTGRGFNILYNHLLTDYPDRDEYDITVYDAYNYHDIFFQVVMSNWPESNCPMDMKIAVCRAFWLGATKSVVAQWTFYEDMECEGFKNDVKAFGLYFDNTVRYSRHIGYDTLQGSKNSRLVGDLIN